MPQKKLDTLLGLPIIGGIVKKKIKKKLGLGRSTHNFSAAAPISLELLLWFDKLGIVIYQALGMTEDSVYAHFCGPGRNKYGTVGKPFKGLQVKFSPEGELRVKSVGNMEGYYKEPELTAETFDEEGFLKTGDMAEYDHEGFLSVTGRVKDQFKTDKGKYIAPGPIETKLLANPVMEQVCVVGTGIPQPIALVVLSEAGKKMEKEALIQNLSASLATVNEHLEKFEKLEKAVIMQETWTIDNGLLTPTMKVKRNQVEKIHMPRYPGWFDQKGKVIWEE
jgi:long-chain acyl-CoA synthetase